MGPAHKVPAPFLLSKFLRLHRAPWLHRGPSGTAPPDAISDTSTIYDSLYDNIDHATIPHAVVILGDYQYKAAFVADQEINLLACMTELMSQVKFK